MNGDHMQSDGREEDKRPEFVLSRPPRPKRPPTVHLDDPTYSAAHMAEGQEAMWLEEEASCTSRVIAAELSKATPASVQVEPPKKTRFAFLPKKTVQQQSEAIPVPEPSQSQPPRKQKFKTIQKSVVLLPQTDGRVNPLVGANAAQEAAVNMNKARSLLNQALNVEEGTPQLEESEKMAKFAFAHAAVARRIMATVDEEATLDGYLEDMSQKGEQAISDHSRIVFSMSFPDTPETKQPWTFSKAVDDYAAQAKQYLESVLPKNVNPSFSEAMSEDAWSQAEISSLGFSGTYQLSTPMPHQRPLVHSVPPHLKTSDFSDVLSMSSLNEILDGEMEVEDEDEAAEIQTGDYNKRNTPSPRSAVPVDIQLKKNSRFGIFSFGSANDAKSKKKEGAAEKEDQVIESRKEDEDERKSQDSVRERPDSNDLDCSTDGQDIETIAVEKFTGDSKKMRVLFGVIRKGKSRGDDSKDQKIPTEQTPGVPTKSIQKGDDVRSAPAKAKGPGSMPVQGRQIQKQKPQRGGHMPPKRQGGPHPTKQAGSDKARPGQNPRQAMPKKRIPGALQTLPSMPSRSIDSEAEEGDLDDKYRTFEEVDSLDNEARKRLESKKPIVGEADISRAQAQRTAENDNNRKAVSKSAEPQTTPTSTSNNSRSAASEERSQEREEEGSQEKEEENSQEKEEEESQEREEEESQESIVSQDEEPADDKIIPRRVRSLPKRLAGIFGGRRGNKPEESASVESTPSTVIQTAMSEEKVIEKAISDGNLMALEANLNAEAAPIIPAQKPRLPPRSTRSVHSDFPLSVINVEVVDVLPPLQESSDEVSSDEVIFAPGRQTKEVPPVPLISDKEKNAPVRRESSKAKGEPVRQVKKEKNEPGGRMAAKEKKVPVRREASKERDAPVRHEARKEKERYASSSKEKEEPLRREASKEKDRASKEKKEPVRRSSKQKEAPARRGESNEKEKAVQHGASKQKNRRPTSEEKNNPIRRKADKEKDKTEHRVVSKEKGEVDRRVSIKEKEVPARRVTAKEKDEDTHRLARKEMGTHLRGIMGEPQAIRKTAEEKNYNMRRSVSEGKNAQTQRMANREKNMLVRAVASQDAPGREAPGRSLKVPNSAKHDPPLKKGVLSQNRNLAPTPRRVDDSKNSRYDQRTITERLYGKKECDMSYTTNGTTTIDGLLSQSESKETYAPELAAITVSSDEGDASETATKASSTILSTMKQLWGRAD
jgi:hypothetical protein